MGSAKTGSQRVNTCLLAKCNCLVRVSIHRTGGVDSATLPGGQCAQLRLYATGIVLCHSYCFFRIFEIFSVGEGAAIIHHAGKTDFQRLRHIVQCLTVVQMHTDGNPGPLGSLHHHRPNLGERRNLLMQLCMGNDNRNIQLLGHIYYRKNTL